jgi:hypothetical protein
LERLKQHHVTAEKTPARFGEEVIRLLDPDRTSDRADRSSGGRVVRKHRTVAGRPGSGRARYARVPQLCQPLWKVMKETARLLIETFGYRLIDEFGNRFRFVSAD